MGMNDAVNYVLFNNPLSHGVWSMVASGAKGLKPKAVPQPAAVVQQAIPSLRSVIGHNKNLVRLAGFSGAAAVAFDGVFRRFMPQDEKMYDREPKQIHELTIQYHMVHTVALLGTPMARYPYLTAALMSSGIWLFCYCSYYNTFTTDNSALYRIYDNCTSVGRVVLVFAWLSFII